MKKLLKISLFFILSFGILGCSTKKQSSNSDTSTGSAKKSVSDIYAILNEKSAIENNILPSDNSLLGVTISFNNGNDSISYMPGLNSVFYRNQSLEDSTIILYSFIDSYDVINDNSKHDILIFENFITSIDKDLTTKHFVDWCLYRAKQEVTNYTK